jgi:Uma2 family endonuclease
MSPHRKHETSTLSIHDFIVILFDELNLDYCAMGHLTCKREDLQRGLEPDCCYYVQNEPMIHGKEDIDLAIDPPPDLMIEVDITNSSLVKLPICAALGVTEHWRYDGEKLQFRILRAGAYAEVSESPAFPGLPLKEAIPDFVKRGRSNGQLRTLREFRKWVRAQLNKKS